MCLCVFVCLLLKCVFVCVFVVAFVYVVEMCVCVCVCVCACCCCYVFFPESPSSDEPLRRPEVQVKRRKSSGRKKRALEGSSQTPKGKNERSGEPGIEVPTKRRREGETMQERLNANAYKTCCKKARQTKT